MWETAIDMKALTALPEGLRLSDLGALPADCLLLEMSKGGLYVPGEVCVVSGAGGRDRVSEREVRRLRGALPHWLSLFLP